VLQAVPFATNVCPDDGIERLRLSARLAGHAPVGSERLSHSVERNLESSLVPFNITEFPLLSFRLANKLTGVIETVLKRPRLYDSDDHVTAGTPRVRIEIICLALDRGPILLQVQKL
jgi:hypothetical protein